MPALEPLETESQSRALRNRQVGPQCIDLSNLDTIKLNTHPILSQLDNCKNKSIQSTIINLTTAIHHNMPTVLDMYEFGSHKSKILIFTLGRQSKTGALQRGHAKGRIRLSRLAQTRSQPRQLLIRLSPFLQRTVAKNQWGPQVIMQIVRLVE